jgi:hypothetical protein
LINNYLKLLTLSDLGQFTTKVTSILRHGTVFGRVGLRKKLNKNAILGLQKEPSIVTFLQLPKGVTLGTKN